MTNLPSSRHTPRERQGGVTSRKRADCLISEAKESLPVRRIVCMSCRRRDGKEIETCTGDPRGWTHDEMRGDSHREITQLARATAMTKRFVDLELYCSSTNKLYETRVIVENGSLPLALLLHVGAVGRRNLCVLSVSVPWLARGVSFL